MKDDATALTALIVVALFIVFISVVHSINTVLDCDGKVVQGLYKLECIDD